MLSVGDSMSPRGRAPMCQRWPSRISIEYNVPHMRHVPPNAGRRHFAIETLTGWDALLSTAADFFPVFARLARRVFAIKILRGWRELPADTHVLYELLNRNPRVYTDRLTFAWRGQLFEITATNGRTKEIPRGDSVQMPGSIA